MEKDQSDPLEFTGALSHPVPRGSRENDDEGPTIIIIDDDENFIESLSVVLRQNYKLILCKNGTEGVNSIHPGVHAVLLDIKMEGKDGFETFKEIKEKYLHIPIIFHSAYQDLKDPYELINEYRPFAYLTKEGNYSNLVNTIDSAVDYSRQLTQNRLLLDDLNMLTGRLREKVSELEHKKNLLKKYSSRVETLLACTNEMSSSADPLEGVKTAVRYILESLKVFRMANISVVLPETLGSYKAAYQCRQIVKFGRLLEHDISLGLSESELELLDKTNGIELNDSTLHIPVVNDSQKLACLLITNIESDTPDEEEIEFINGIIKSLSLVLDNHSQERSQKLAAVGQMASEIVHDLKNNVMVIHGYAELLDDDELGSELRKNYITSITGESDRLVEMAQDILDFSRGTVHLERKKHDLNEYLGEILQFLEPLFRRQQMTFEYHIKSRGEAFIDGSRMRRVIINIAHNACEAMLPGGKFIIEAVREKNGVTMFFQDTGSGIPPEIKDSIFSPFVTMGKSQGTGLGMAMAKNIVDAHKGDISFETDPQKGTRFIIQIPD